MTKQQLIKYCGAARKGLEIGFKAFQALDGILAIVIRFFHEINVENTEDALSNSRNDLSNMINPIMQKN